MRVVEATGEMAFIGAIPEFKTTKYLQTAAAIQGTEARHTAVITSILNGLTGGSLPVSPLFNDNNGRDQAKMPAIVLTEIRPFIVLKSEQTGQ